MHFRNKFLGDFHPIVQIYKTNIKFRYELYLRIKNLNLKIKNTILFKNVISYK